MLSSSEPIPLDVLVLIKAAIDPKLVGPHLLLSNLSRRVRDCLYPTDRTWRKLLNGMGIGRSLYDLDGKERTRWWREIAVEVARHEQDDGEPGACTLHHTDWIDDERGPFQSMCSHVRKYNDETYRVPLVVYSLDQVRAERLEVEPHEKLGDFDCQGDDCNFLGFMARCGMEIDRTKEGCLCREHPVVCHSFATVPPVSFMTLGGIDVTNADGVTQWDVKVAYDKAYPYITQREFYARMGETYTSMADQYYMDVEEAKKKKLVRVSDFSFPPERIYEGQIYRSWGEPSVEFTFASGS